MSNKSMRYLAGFVALYDLATTGGFYRDREEQFTLESALVCREYVRSLDNYKMQTRELELDYDGNKLHFRADDCFKYYKQYQKQYKASKIIQDFIMRDGRNIDIIAHDMELDRKALYYMSRFERRIPNIILGIIIELDKENPLWSIEDYVEKYKHREIR